MSAAFQTFVDDIFVIFKEADTNHILESLIPAELHESNPVNLCDSYTEYVQDHEEFATVSVLERYGQGYYTSIYKIYHDIRLACLILIPSQKIGTTFYIDIDFFYKFATELLLRESYRLNLAIAELVEARDRLEEGAPPSEFEEALNEDFNKITSAYNSANGEAYFLTTGSNMPLFSSLNGKSSLDTREVIVPEPFQPTIVTSQNFQVPATNLSFLSPQISKIPNPTLAPTEILTNFFHPNWYSITHPVWLQLGSASSFAPTHDSNGAIISNELKNNLWFEQIGQKHLKEIRESYEARFKEKFAKEEEVDSIEVESIEDEEVKTEVAVTTEIQQINGVSKSVEYDGKTLDIDLDHLVEWTPGSVIDEDEIEAVKEGKEQQLVSKLLIDLNKVRHKRYLKSTPQKIIKPTSTERNLYFKIKRLLVRLVGELNPSDLNLEFEKKIPILLNNYAGSLPAPPVTIAPKQTTRLMGLPRGSYKKKR